MKRGRKKKRGTGDLFCMKGEGRRIELGAGNWNEDTDISCLCDEGQAGRCEGGRRREKKTRKKGLLMCVCVRGKGKERRIIKRGRWRMEKRKSREEIVMRREMKVPL